jgi:hypothetical protein
MIRGGPAPALQSLTAAVQANCDIADARHAGELSMCQFLLQMREFYRWQQGLGFDQPPPRAALGRWLAEREAAWAELEDRPYVPLPLGGRAVDPFDLESIDAALRPAGLVYGAGWVDAGRPGFFLAEALRVDDGGPGPTVLHCGRELARGLFAPPAALQGGHTIVLRCESMARWLWEQWEGFALHRPSGAFAVWMAGHGVVDDAGFIAALPRLVDDAAEVLELHERGEHAAGRWLEPGWAMLRSRLSDRRATLTLRALRDLIADCRTTLPTLLARGRPALLHCWFAGFDGQRAALHPGLAAAYAAWSAGDLGLALRRACTRGDLHFGALARELLAAAGEGGAGVDDVLVAQLARVMPLGCDAGPGGRP